MRTKQNVSTNELVNPDVGACRDRLVRAERALRASKDRMVSVISVLGVQEEL